MNEYEFSKALRHIRKAIFAQPDEPPALPKRDPNGNYADLDLLSAIEEIVSLARGSALSPDFYTRAAPFLQYMATKLNLTPQQCVMMALFIDNSEDGSISISDFSKFLNCTTTRLLRYTNDIDTLEQRDLIRCSRAHNCIRYRVPFEVIEAFKHNQCYQPRDLHNLSCIALFAEIDRLFDMRDDNEITYDHLVQKIDYLFQCNPQLLFVQRISGYKYDDDTRMLLLLFAHLFVNNNDDHITFLELDDLYDEVFTWRTAKDDLSNGNHILQTDHLIEYTNSDGFADRSCYCLTNATKRYLFEELHLSSLDNARRHADIIQATEITPKQLFFDQKTTAQIDELHQLLEQENYLQITDRMHQTGFRCAFTCLFYGQPGTGKTETALQLARQTGRDIMQVNIAQIKSMWVGESEKNIKLIFDTYRRRTKDSPITPILLFNEADAVIGIRREGAERAVDKMENTLQNIILQEMETLDGILIATTNLVQNLDHAFERRFLYKLRFQRPTAESRQQMWLTMIPALTEEQALHLAQLYDFSGGQIENIARQHTISTILHGQPADLVAALVTHCNNERIDTQSQQIRGFHQ